MLTQALGKSPISKDLSTLTKSKICEILKVDAVLSGSMTGILLKTHAAQIRASLGIGFGPSERADISVSIYESETREMLWQHDDIVKGYVMSTPERVVITRGVPSTYGGITKSMTRGIRRTVRNFPYEN